MTSLCTCCISCFSLAVGLLTAVRIAAAEPSPAIEHPVKIHRYDRQAEVVVPNTFYPPKTKGTFGVAREKRGEIEYFGSEMKSDDKKIVTKVMIRTPIVDDKVEIVVDSTVPVTLCLYPYGLKLDTAFRALEEPVAKKVIKIEAGRHEYNCTLTVP
jgi:hypothetical protein